MARKPSINKVTFDSVVRTINRRIAEGEHRDEAASNVIIDMPFVRLMRCLTYIAVEEGHEWYTDKTWDGTFGEQMAEVLHEYICEYVLEPEC